MEATLTLKGLSLKFWTIISYIHSLKPHIKPGMNFKNLKGAHIYTEISIFFEDKYALSKHNNTKSLNNRYRHVHTEYDNIMRI